MKYGLIMGSQTHMMAFVRAVRVFFRVFLCKIREQFL